MAKAVMIKTPGMGYVPYNDASKKMDKRVDYGGMIEFNCNVIRDPAAHRRFFAMIGAAYKQANTKRTRNRFRSDLTFEAGFFEVRINHMGKTYAVVLSLDYASMDNDEFQSVHSRTLDVIIQTLGFDDETQIYFIQNFGVPNS